MLVFGLRSLRITRKAPRRPIFRIPGHGFNGRVVPSNARGALQPIHFVPRIAWEFCRDFAECCAVRLRGSVSPAASCCPPAEHKRPSVGQGESVRVRLVGGQHRQWEPEAVSRSAGRPARGLYEDGHRLVTWTYSTRSDQVWLLYKAKVLF